MDDSARLLEAYLNERDPAAFEAWVRGHLDLVYSAARRHAGGDAHLAQEITQMVFLTAFRKTASLARHPAPLAWLHQTTRLAASELRRAEARRLTRETRAAIDPALAPDVNSAEAPVDWSRVEPLLDEALATLGERDREAVLLRYFSGQAYAAIGQKLGFAENTARVRTDRALEKLRRALAARGVTSTATALGLALGANAVSAAPASAATSTLDALAAWSSGVAAPAATVGTATTASTASSVSVVFTTMTTSTKLTLGVAAATLFALGATSGVLADRHLIGASPVASSSSVATASPPVAKARVLDPETVAHVAEIAALKKELAAKDARLAEQAVLLEKHASAQKENEKRRVFRSVEELGKYTAEVSLRFLDMQERYGKIRMKKGSPEEAAFQAEVAQLTQDSALLLEDPLFTDEMKSGDPARITALQLSYLGEILKLSPEQREVFTRVVEAAYRTAYDQKMEWAMTDERLKQLNAETVKTVKAALSADQAALWERARLNRLLFNFSVGTP